MNENEKNFQYIKDFSVEFLNSIFELKEIVLCLKEGSTEKSNRNEEKEQEVEKSFEVLILNELPKHLKYTFLGSEKTKSMIIATDLTEEKEQKLL